MGRGSCPERKFIPGVESKEERKSRAEANKAAKKKKPKKEKADDFNDVLSYVAGVVDHYSTQWDAQVKMPVVRPPTDHPKGPNPESIQALTEYMRAMTGARIAQKVARKAALEGLNTLYIEALL